MLCEFVQTRNGWVKCRRCPNRMKSTTPEKCFAECRSGEPPLLGDWLAGFLHDLGFIKCKRCDWRRKALNKIHKRLRSLVK